MSAITLFEQNNFEKYIQTLPNDSKATVFKATIGILNCLCRKQSEISMNNSYFDIIMEHIESFNISFHRAELENGAIKTCLGDCGAFLDFVGAEARVNDFLSTHYPDMDQNSFLIFLDRFAYFITDSIIIEWKKSRNIPYNTITVINNKHNIEAKFPLSYNTQKLINEVETITGKKVVFSTGYSPTAIVKKETIICYFDKDRLYSEHIIQTQLMEIKLELDGFLSVDRMFFNNLDNIEFSMQNMRTALHIYYQMQLSNKILRRDYPIFKDDEIFTIVENKSKELYMKFVYIFICNYLKQIKICKKCLVIDLDFTSNDTCPLFDNDGLIHCESLTEEISSPEGIICIVEKLIDFMNEKVEMEKNNV